MPAAHAFVVYIPNHSHVSLTLSPCKAEKLALATITNSHKAEIPAWNF